MANIRIDLNHAPHDGEAITFKAPCDAKDISGLIIYHPDENGATTSREFTFNDANGGDIGALDNIFAAGAIVKVILDTDVNNAYVQNPDTNTYLEGRFEKVKNAASTYVGDEEPTDDSVLVWFTDDGEAADTEALMNRLASIEARLDALERGSGGDIPDGPDKPDNPDEPDEPVDPDEPDEPDLKKLAIPEIELEIVGEPDEPDKPSNVTITPAILGAAVLGQTILGNTKVLPKLNAPKIWLDDGRPKLPTPDIELVVGIKLTTPEIELLEV